MFSLQPDKPPFVCLPIRDSECVCMSARLFYIPDFLYFLERKCHRVYCLCVCVFESILEAGVFCFSVYGSMYACKVRPGGSEPCLLVICKDDKELRHGTRVFVSIARKNFFT